MYNPKVKEIYIEFAKKKYSSRVIDSLIKTFIFSEKFEKSFSKDLFDFTQDDVKILINAFPPKAISRICLVLEVYYIWYYTDYLNLIEKLQDNPFNEEKVKGIVNEILRGKNES